MAMGMCGVRFVGEGSPENGGYGRLGRSVMVSEGLASHSWER